MTPAPRCMNCQRPVSRAKTKAGGPVRSMDLHRMDPNHFFCTMRCAATFGILCAQVIAKQKAEESHT